MQVSHVIINQENMPNIKDLGSNTAPELHCERTYIKDNVIVFEYMYLGLLKIKK